MLLPHFLYVVIFLTLSAIIAGFIVYVLLKAIPRSGSTVSGSLRGCAGLFAFMFLLLASLLGLMWLIPSSTIIIAGPDKEHTRKEAILFTPTSLIEKYGISDFGFDKNYIINTSDRNMMIYKVSYSNIPTFSKPNGPVIEIPAGKCTYIKHEYLPDFYFEEPEYISVKSTEAKQQDRWVLDYTPLNP